MKKIISLILFWIVTFTVFPISNDTIITYFNKDWKKTNNIKKAFYYRKAYKNKDNLWEVKDFYLTGQIQMLGYYSDKKLKQQQGLAYFYHYNGKISSIGQYKDNTQIGIWEHYYPNGTLYGKGKRVGFYRDSLWTFYERDGTLAGITNFKNGKTDGISKWYYPSGKIVEEIHYQNGNKISKKNFDESGNEIFLDREDSLPLFPGGKKALYEFLNTNIEYPAELLNKRIEGTVILRFVVTKEGKIEDIDFEKADHELFNKEALRVVNLIEYMEPAFQYGLIRELEMRLPIVFSLKRSLF